MESCQRWLIRRGDDSSAIEGGIIEKLPLVVSLLVVEFPNGVFLAEAGHAYDRATDDKLLAARARVPGSLGSLRRI